jgi:hypothetical protein
MHTFIEAVRISSHYCYSARGYSSVSWCSLPNNTIDVRYYFLQEVMTQDNIIVKKIAMVENPADMHVD